MSCHWAVLFLNCPTVGLSSHWAVLPCCWTVLLLNCPIVGLSCHWTVLLLNVPSLSCPVIELSCCWTVLLLNVLSLSCPVIELSCCWTVLLLNVQLLSCSANELVTSLVCFLFGVFAFLFPLCWHCCGSDSTAWASPCTVPSPGMLHYHWPAVCIQVTRHAAVSRWLPGTVVNIVRQGLSCGPTHACLLVAHVGTPRVCVYNLILPSGSKSYCLGGRGCQTMYVCM